MYFCFFFRLLLSVCVFQDCFYFSLYGSVVFFFFFLHCLSFFCTESWAMVPTSFAVGTGPGILMVVSLFFFYFFCKMLN